MLPILALQRHEKSVQSMAFSQDSVYTGSEDMEIKVSWCAVNHSVVDIMLCFRFSGTLNSEPGRFIVF